MSVIIPVYNAESSLEACLDSVLKQTCREFEVIAVNDGSTDRSGAILDAIARSNARLRVLHRPNRGLSAARNAGICMARGRYLGFVDADDFIDPTMYESLWAVARHDDADVVKCGYRVLEPGRTPRVVQRPQSGRIAWTGGRPAVLAYLANGIDTVVWDGLYARYLFRTIRFPEGRIHEDTFTTPLLLNAARRVVLLDAALYNHRKCPGSITGSFSIRRLDEVWARVQLWRTLEGGAVPGRLRDAIDLQVARSISRNLRLAYAGGGMAGLAEACDALGGVIPSTELLRVARNRTINVQARLFLRGVLAGPLAAATLLQLDRPWQAYRRARDAFLAGNACPNAP
ncbi:glycosyl transferase CpsJ(V) [Thioalkalivibrio paradoxus ARh 1]|uniref:Glycosyl transferase CpsJ(V) n=1 Tax=Thioalkalivibrio paradoxus ARh 1 TaxID=713585 RepID=W0DIF6_9GAMM|nr:glycosyl transferase CpsJ(V) [Thioalkalivibrio paradoxus ARh 1]